MEGRGGGEGGRKRAWGDDGVEGGEGVEEEGEESLSHGHTHAIMVCH